MVVLATRKSALGFTYKTVTILQETTTDLRATNLLATHEWHCRDWLVALLRVTTFCTFAFENSTSRCTAREWNLESVK